MNSFVSDLCNYLSDFLGVDNYGVPQTVADAQRTYVNGITFDSRGLPSQINLGNGTNETYSFNDRFQLDSQSLKLGTTVQQKYDYGYGQIDASTGNLDATKNNGQLGRIEAYIGANKQWTQKFQYDSIGRLKQAEERRADTDTLSYKQVFDFDRFGNLYRKAANNPTTGQATPLAFTPIEDSDINRSKNQLATGTTYDDAGAVVSDTKFRNMGFAYDANGRQIKATQANTPDALTVYDALGNRVATKVNDVWQNMIYDAFGQLVAEYGASSTEGAGGVKYVFQDWQGSVRAITNSNGYVVARTDHQAFGEEIGFGIGIRASNQGYAAEKIMPQGYASTENDEATGQQHTWARKLEAAAGRWTSPDPYKGSMFIEDPQTINRYSYVQNQPSNFVDPSGLRYRLECVFVTGYDEDGSAFITFGGCDMVDGPDAWQGYGGKDRDRGTSGDPGAILPTITPKEDTPEANCYSIRRAIKSHIKQANRHLRNYGPDFYQWVAKYPPFNYLTGQLDDYQNHVDEARYWHERYKSECREQGEPPELPQFKDVPVDIRYFKPVLPRLLDSLPGLPSKKELEKKGFPKLSPGIPLPPVSPVYNW